MRNLALSDPQIAAATFRDHLQRLWESGRPAKLGWARKDVDELHSVVTLPAVRKTGDIDHYHFRLGAEYYDLSPPTVALVQPDGFTHADGKSRWFPVLESLPPWFGLHEKFKWPNGEEKQLVCFTLAAEYYMTDHSPKEFEIWKKGEHTVAATLYRLAEILSPTHYRRSAG